MEDALGTAAGLPLHPLVVHAVVVLVPLSVLGLLALLLRPAWRERYAGLLALVSVVALVLCPVATSSGEALEHLVGDPGEHAELGDQLVLFVLPVVAVAVLLWWTTRRAARGGAALARRWATALVVVGVVASLACAVQVVRVGDSGARAAWGDAAQQTSGGAGEEHDGDDD